MGTRGRQKRSRFAVALSAAVLSTFVLFAQTASSGSHVECRYGAISAIGPVDAQGNGDTTPEVRCLEP